MIQDLVGRQLFQGAVVIGRGGVVQYPAGFGFADRERQVPFTPETPTDAASMAKTFTAAALLLLAAEGRVDLDAPVQDILPSFPHAATRVLIAVAEGRRPERLAPPPAAAAAPDPSGTYQVPVIGKVVVRRDGGRLLVRVRAVEYEAFPLGSDVHFVPGLDASLRFTLAPKGGVVLWWDSVFDVASARRSRGS